MSIISVVTMRDSIFGLCLHVRYSLYQPLTVSVAFFISSTLWEEFEDTKGVIIIRISKKNRQHNGQKKKYKSTNNDPQNMHIKLKIEQHEPH